MAKSSQGYLKFRTELAGRLWFLKHPGALRRGLHTHTQITRSRFGDVKEITLQLVTQILQWSV